MLLNKELTEEQRLSKAVVAILSEPRYTALAGVLMIGDKTVDDNVDTAYTNGRDEVYGRAFIAELNDAELRFLVLHETYHKLFRHLITWKHLWDTNPKVANIAMDHNINIKITDENKDRFAVMPECGCRDERFRGMNSQQIFDIIYKEQKQGGGGNKGGEGGGGVPDSEVGNSLPDSMDEHDWSGANSLTEEERSQLDRDVDEAIRQGALSAGKMGHNVDRDLDELLKPQVDWREVLREFINATCSGSDYSTWNRPNRRFLGQGVYLPSGVSEKVEELVLAVDTSGSIGQRELTLFLTEVKAICTTVKPSKVRLLYWGGAVVGDESYATDELDDLVRSTKPVGGGGTDVECVTEYMKEERITPQAVIVLTDGHLFGVWGDWSCPLLWAILDNKGAKPNVGKVTHIESRNM